MRMMMGNEVNEWNEGYDGCERMLWDEGDGVMGNARNYGDEGDDEDEG